jgi:hypothetical protein
LPVAKMGPVWALACPIPSFSRWCRHDREISAAGEIQLRAGGSAQGSPVAALPQESQAHPLLHRRGTGMRSQDRCHPTGEETFTARQRNCHECAKYWGRSKPAEWQEAGRAGQRNLSEKPRPLRLLPKTNELLTCRNHAFSLYRELMPQ